MNVEEGEEQQLY